MSYRTRDHILSEIPAFEGSHAILYRSGTNAFNTPIYNIGILKNDCWKNYTTDHSAWSGHMDGLIIMAKSANEMAKLITETFEKNGIEEVVRLVARGEANWNMAYDLTGYYISEKVGEFVGPNKHCGKVTL